ncbi:MAG: fold metallo-hydrolase [Moraxellaceae bacterium]|jgi:ribonuclease J|nr:fold metallo-hydrolase [Moraxellaceae bacterium]
MHACIHRGATQIGGSCVELEHEGQRLIIDLGLPLDAPDNSRERLPASLDLNGLAPCAVVVSHPHQDHYGLLHHLPSGIPVVMGKAARRIVQAAAPFTGQVLPGLEGPELVDRVPLQVGPFRITPFLVDHSAYDAYALMVEAGGRRIFYSGDFRGHGRKSALLDRLLAAPPSPIHALLMEGTSLGRNEESPAYPTESELEAELTTCCRDTAGLVMVHASAQNIDRVVTLFRAAKKSGRTLVIDLYAAAILEAAGGKRLPQSDWEGVALYVPFRQRLQIKRQGCFDLLARHQSKRIYAEALAADPGRYALLFRPLHSNDLERAACLKGAAYVYSQWQGYWESGSYDDLKNWLEAQGIPRHSIHTSGHADVPTLRRFVTGLAPERLVPIHSFNPQEFSGLYDKVEWHADGERWAV